MTIASFFDSRTKSSIIQSFIRPAGPVVATDSQNKWRGEAKKIHGVVTSCASSPPLTPHSEQGLCPLNFYQASYEFEALRRVRHGAVWRHSAAALPAKATADNDRVYLSAASFKRRDHLRSNSNPQSACSVL